MDRDLAALAELQLQPAEIDLRGWAGEPTALREHLAACGALWVSGARDVVNALWAGRVPVSGSGPPA